MRNLPAFIVFILITMTACAGLPRAIQTSPAAEHQLVVLATTTHIADFARNVAGSRAIVTSLLPVNVDAHTYEPTPLDAKKISQADVILTHGLQLDAWVQKLIVNAGGGGQRFVVTKGLPVRAGDEESPDGDPHVWRSHAVPGRLCPNRQMI